MAGIALMTFALELGVDGIPTIVICAGVALVGLIACALSRPALKLSVTANAEALWAGGCALAAYAIGLAPVAGSGRSAIAGYVLNNDPAVHLSAIELLRDNGTQATEGGLSSYHSVEGLFEAAYPLGSFPWVLFGNVTGGIEPFHLWTPLIALTAGLTALVSFWILRRIGAPRPFAAIAGAVIASGYLPFSYLAQGGTKEVITALTIYATVALFVHGATERFGWRALLPAAVGAGAAIHNLGLGALAWLGPAGAVIAVVLLWRPPRGRTRVGTAVTLAICGLAALVVALPSILSSIDYLNQSEDLLLNPAQIGNLVGPVPWSEAFNVWFAYDYRLPDPDRETLTAIGVLLAALLAGIGILNALARRQIALLLAVFTGVAGAVVISSRYAIYFDAKSYMALAPSLGLASAAGVLWLYLRRSARERIGGLVLGVLLAAGVLVSDAYVYAGSWTTPKDRFQEMIDIGERFRGEGPMLINEREEYSKYFLRDSLPWESWGSWQPDRGLRFSTVPAVPTTPDFDYYTSEHMARFKLLLERRRPGGSLPPSNFRVVHETEHYRVWRRVANPPREHLPLGLKGLSGTSHLDCSDPTARRLIERARRTGSRVRAAYAGNVPVVTGPGLWEQFANWGLTPTEGFVSWRSGFAIARKPPLDRGRYTAYLQGSFGPGIRVYIGEKQLGEAFGDLGIQDGWQPLGVATVKRNEPTVVLLGLEKSALRPGSRRYDMVGQLAFVPEPENRKVTDLDGRRARELCGKRLDWVELL
jgi:hypothetical protein